MKKTKYLFILLFFGILFINSSKLSADDSGFKYAFGTSITATNSIDNFKMYYELNSDFSYLTPFWRVEFGLGATYLYKEVLTGSYEYAYQGQQIKLPSVTKRSLLPLFVFVRKSFDILEEGFIVVDFRYGRYLKNNYQDSFNNIININNISTNVLQTSRVKSINFYGISAGYEYEGLLIALDYRMNIIEQSITLQDTRGTLLLDKSRTFNNSYIGLKFSFVNDLF